MLGLVADASKPLRVNIHPAYLRHSNVANDTAISACVGANDSTSATTTPALPSLLPFVSAAT